MKISLSFKYKFRLASLIISLMLILLTLNGCTYSSGNSSPTDTIAPMQTPNKLQPYVSRMNTGSSKKLLGKCLFVSIFLSDDKSSFSEEEKRKSIDNLGVAFDYLLEKANDYGKSFEPIYDLPDIILDYKVNFTLPKSSEEFGWEDDVLDDALAQNNMEDVLEKYNADNISYIFHIQKTGRSYACLKFNDSGKEIAVMLLEHFSFDKDFKEYRHDEYAHEILHLFGAIDLYYPNDNYDYRRNLAWDVWRTDIMYTSMFLLGASLGEVDAYLVGWLNELKEEYHIFIPTPTSPESQCRNNCLYDSKYYYFI